MATDLGQLVYTLTLRDEGFQGQLGSASAKVKESSGQMTGFMKETEEQSGKTGGAFSGMAGQFVAGAALFTVGQKALSAIKDVIKDGIKSYEDFQTNQAQIANSLKTTKDASGQSTKGLNEYADALSSQTAISGNAINSAQLVMLNYKAIGKDIFPTATKSVADLAAVISGGAVPNAQQMSMAANTMGKALEDPAKGMLALRRAHVQLSPEQQEAIKNMEKSGNMAGAQKLLLSDLADVIGGKATTAAHTLSGEQAQLHAQLEKVEIKIGTDLANAFKTIEPYLAAFLDFIAKHKAALYTVIAVIGAVITTLTIGLVGALLKSVSGFVTTGVEAEKASLKIIASAIKTVAQTIISAAATAAAWIASAVAAAAAWVIANGVMMLGIGLVVAVIALAVVEIVKHWGTIKRGLEDAWNAMKELFADGINFIKAHWALIVDILLGPLGIVITNVIQHWQAIKNGFLDAVNFVKAVWGTIVGFFGSIMGSVTGAIRNGVSAFGGMLYNAGRDLINGLIHGIESMAGAVTDKVKNISKDIENTAKKILKIFSPSQVFSDIGANVSLGLAQGIGDNAKHAITATNNLTTNVIQAGVPVSTVAGVSNNSVGGTTYNFAGASFNFSTKDAVDEFFSIGNRSTALELQGGSPLAGTTGV